MGSTGTSPVANGSFKFLVPTDVLKTEKPYMSSVPFSGKDSRTSNFTEKSYPLQIEDVRATGAIFELDRNGFQYVTHDFENHPHEKIEGPDHPYLREVAAFLKAFVAAKDVVVYDCNVRKIGNKDFFQAATSAHIDHTTGNALWRLQEALEMQRPDGVKFDRWEAITLWRPVSNMVTDWPLAVCDYTSIERKDLHAVDTVLPHRVNEIYHLEHNPNQRWYYMSDQRPNEAIVMKIYDSDSSRATYSAHAAFDLTRSSEIRGPPRHSADVRAFALF